MSRRDDPSSESKRRRSRFDREPSPKKSRRDGKPETERPPAELDMDKDRPDRDHRNHRRLQDPLSESVNVGRDSENGTDAQKGVTKHSSEATKVPQSYFQHDDRGQNGRGFRRRTDSERGWRRDPIPKEQRNYSSLIDTRHKDENSKDNNRDTWRHDGYFEMEVNSKPPPRRRPSFREQKMPSDAEKTDRAVNNSVMPNPQDRPIEYGSRNDRGHNSRYSDRPVAGERESNKAQSWRGNFSSGDRFNGNNRQRGRERFPARQGYNPTGGHAEKWKHDLYDEANKSPPSKNEEDQISKIESLLAS